MTARLVNDLAEVIREIDPDNQRPVQELSAQLATRLVAFYGADELYAEDVVAFVERTDPDKQMSASHLAELIVAEFDLDGADR